MKNSLFLFIFLVLLIACKPKTTEQNVQEDYMVYNLKVVGLADSTIADSIWKINFLDGVESVYIKPTDSLISIKAETSKITRPELFEIVEEYGVQIIDAN